MGFEKLGKKGESSEDFFVFSADEEREILRKAGEFEALREKIGLPAPEGSNATNEVKTGIIVERVCDRLAEKYHLGDIPENERNILFRNTLESALYDVGRVFGGMENVRGKRILDIASGSLSSQQDKKDSPRLYEPWFCRALLELGAEPVAVDIGNLEGEEFEHHNVDLSVRGSLNIFPDKSFDGVHLSKLITSPTFRDMTEEDERRGLIKEIEVQMDRLLRDDGKKIREGLWWDI